MLYGPATVRKWHFCLIQRSDCANVAAAVIHLQMATVQMETDSGSESVRQSVYISIINVHCS